MHELNVCLTHLHNPILFSHEALSLIAEASVNVIQVTGIVFFEKMEKTIENIKKILHIGAGSKVEKKNGKIHSNGSYGSTPEKQKMNHQAVTTSVEINHEENKR